MVRTCIPFVLATALCVFALGASAANHRPLACDGDYYTLEILEEPPIGEATSNEVHGRHRLAKRGVPETYIDGSKRNLSFGYANLPVSVTLEDYSFLAGTTKFLMQLEGKQSRRAKCFKVMHKKSDDCVGMCSIEQSAPGVGFMSAAGPIDAQAASGDNGYLWIRLLLSGAHVWDIRIVREAVYGKVITFHI